MKRIISAVFFVLFVLSISGCDTYQKNENYEVKEALMEVYDCLLHGDKDRLKSMLCKDLQTQEDVDEQIDAFFEGIGGGIQSGDTESISFLGLGKSRKLDETDRYTTESSMAIMQTIIGNNGVEYATLSVAYNHYYKTNPDLLGIYAIDITEDSFYSIYRIEHANYRRPKQTKQERSVTELTQEQENEIAALEEKNNCYMQYLRAVASGEIDPDSPKLTLDDVKRIIREAEGLNVGTDESGVNQTNNDRALYISQEIIKIQFYPDTLRVSGSVSEKEYWLTNDEATGERTQIHLLSGGRIIRYEEINKDGKIKNSEVLFEA